MMDDLQLTDHFTLYDLTKTSLGQYQEKNRVLSPGQIFKLTNVAKLLEHVMFILSTPITVTSGYRCPELNKAIGSTDRSQHMLCEAADFIPGQLDIGEAFRLIWKDIKVNNANVGQLIHETANRHYGTTSWIHLSLGEPYREASRCKQILRLEGGKYTRLA